MRNSKYLGSSYKSARYGGWSGVEERLAGAVEFVLRHCELEKEEEEQVN